jgi:hypothetical protein
MVQASKMGTCEQTSSNRPVKQKDADFMAITARRVYLQAALQAWLPRLSLPVATRHCQGRGLHQSIIAAQKQCPSAVKPSTDARIRIHLCSRTPQIPVRVEYDRPPS